MAHIQDKRAQGRGWVARWVDPDGKEKSKRFDRKSEADNYLTDIRKAVRDGSYIDPDAAKTTVADYYAEWSKRQPWRESTRVSVQTHFAHILAAFGRRPLGSLKRGEIEAWGAALPLAGRTARICMAKFSTMLEAAAADGLIARNPAHKAKRPLVDEEPIIPPTSDELEAIRSHLPDWFAVAVTLGAACGLREGEAAGLSVDNINFLARTLTVDRQLRPGSSGAAPTFSPPKNRRGYRTVPLADVALEDLARHVERHGTGAEGLVLHREGRPVHRSGFARLWRRAREKAGVREIRFHDGRHYFASVLLSGGVSVPATSEYLGHTSAMLLRTYGHLVPQDHDRARGVVQAAFRSEAKATAL